MGKQFTPSMEAIGKNFEEDSLPKELEDRIRWERGKYIYTNPYSGFQYITQDPKAAEHYAKHDESMAKDVSDRVLGFMKRDNRQMLNDSEMGLIKGQFGSIAKWQDYLKGK